MERRIDRKHWERLKKLTKSSVLLPAAFVCMLLLVLLPRGGGEQTPEATEPPGGEERFDLSAEERRLEEILSLIAGAGRVRVRLSVADSGERVLAQAGEEPAVVSAGSGKEEAVELSRRSARYLGAVVVSEGARGAELRLALTKAVEAFTGLGSDRIRVFEMKAGEEKP